MKKVFKPFAQGFGRIRNHSAKLIRSEPVIVRSCSSFVHSFNSFVQLVRMGRSTQLHRLRVRVCVCMRVYVCVTPWAWIISPNNHNKPQSYIYEKSEKKNCRLKNYPYICR